MVVPPPATTPASLVPASDAGNWTDWTIRPPALLRLVPDGDAIPVSRCAVSAYVSGRSAAGVESASCARGGLAPAIRRPTVAGETGKGGPAARQRPGPGTESLSLDARRLSLSAAAPRAGPSALGVGAPRRRAPWTSGGRGRGA